MCPFMAPKVFFKTEGVANRSFDLSGRQAEVGISGGGVHTEGQTAQAYGKGWLERIS
jgi:hypothetical protein